MSLQFRFIGVGYQPFWREATLTASSAAADLPAYNTRDHHRTKVWRATDCAEEWLDADFGVDEPEADCIAVINHNLSPGGQIYVQASNTAPGGSDLLDETFNAWAPLAGWGDNPWGEFPWGGPAAGVGRVSAGPVAIHYFAAPVAARYWRVGFVDPDNTAGYVQAGHLILDRHWAPVMNNNWNHELGFKDASMVQESLGGQEWVNERMRRGVLSFEFSKIAPDDVYQGFLEVFRCCGRARPFVVDPVFGDTDLVRRWQYRMYVKFASDHSVRQGNPWRATAPIRLIEAL